MREEICSILRERIFELTLKPGTPLNEKKLAEEFNVSRTPVREALLVLSTEGLVNIAPHQGARVSDVNLRDFQELFEVRIILEKGVARLAAKNVAAEQIEELERLSELAVSTDPREVNKLINLDKEFHSLINKAAGNRILEKQLSHLQHQYTRLSRLTAIKPELFIADLPEVIDSLKHKDADRLEHLLVKHVNYFVEKVRKKFFFQGKV